MYSRWAPQRVRSSWEGGAHLHSLPRRTGTGTPCTGYGTDRMCPEVYSVDAVQRNDTHQQCRWSVSSYSCLKSLVCIISWLQWNVLYLSLNGTGTSYPLFMPPELAVGTHTGSCGHVMHATCWQKWVINKIAHYFMAGLSGPTGDTHYINIAFTVITITALYLSDILRPSRIWPGTGSMRRWSLTWRMGSTCVPCVNLCAILLSLSFRWNH